MILQNMILTNFLRVKKFFINRSPTSKPSVSVESLPWYYGRISREEAEKMLRSAQQGTPYLLRDSRQHKNGYVLSIQK